MMSFELLLLLFFFIWLNMLRKMALLNSNFITFIDSIESIDGIY